LGLRSLSGQQPCKRTKKDGSRGRVLAEFTPGGKKQNKEEGNADGDVMQKGQASLFTRWLSWRSCSARNLPLGVKNETKNVTCTQLHSLAFVEIAFRRNLPLGVKNETKIQAK
jgi:hypothetical protein